MRRSRGSAAGRCGLPVPPAAGGPSAPSCALCSHRVRFWSTAAETTWLDVSTDAQTYTTLEASGVAGAGRARRAAGGGPWRNGGVGGWVGGGCGGGGARCTMGGRHDVGRAHRSLKPGTGSFRPPLLSMPCPAAPPVQSFVSSTLPAVEVWLDSLTPVSACFMPRSFSRKRCPTVWLDGADAACSPRPTALLIKTLLQAASPVGSNSCCRPL